jgi:hypothetical protein
MTAIGPDCSEMATLELFQVVDDRPHLWLTGIFCVEHCIRTRDLLVGQGARTAIQVRKGLPAACRWTTSAIGGELPPSARR